MTVAPLVVTPHGVRRSAQIANGECEPHCRWWAVSRRIIQGLGGEDEVDANDLELVDQDRRVRVAEQIELDPSLNRDPQEQEPYGVLVVKPGCSEPCRPDDVGQHDL